MARTRTLTNLIADVRQHADAENSNTFSDAELTEYINQGIAELYEMLVKHRGHEFYASSGSLTLVAGTETYSLPEPHMETLRVTIEANGQTVALVPYSLHEREAIQPNATYQAQPTHYRLRAGNISLLPLTDAVYPCTLWYVPYATRLSSGSDTFDGINGWEEYAVWRAVAYCMAKEDRDGSFAGAMLARLEARINALAPHRSAESTERVRDVVTGRLGSTLRPWGRLPRP